MVFESHLSIFPSYFLKRVIREIKKNKNNNNGTVGGATLSSLYQSCHWLMLVMMEERRSSHTLLMKQRGTMNNLLITLKYQFNSNRGPDNNTL